MQYQIFWVNLDPTQGSEINKTRPCVVISPEEMNKHLKTVIIAPITSTLKEYPTRMNILIGKEENQIALDQIRTISKNRLQGSLKKKSKLTNQEIICLKEILKEMLVE